MAKNILTNNAISELITKIKTALSLKSDTGHTHNKSEVGLSNVDNTADSNKDVKTAKYPYGFNSRTASAGWGNQNGTFTTGWGDSKGGEIHFRANSGQLNTIIDGFYYQNEGNSKVLDESNIDSALSSTSTNPVQNKVITEGLNGKVSTADLPYTLEYDEANQGTLKLKDNFYWLKADTLQATSSIEVNDFTIGMCDGNGWVWVMSNLFTTLEGSILADASGYEYCSASEEEGSDFNVLAEVTDGDTTSYRLGTLKVATPTHDHDAATKAYVDGQVISASFSDFSINIDSDGYYYYSQQAFADAHSISPSSPIETFYDWESNGLSASDEVVSAYNKLAYSKLDSDGNLTIYSTSTEDLSNTLTGIYLAFKVNGSISTS